jgi:transcriptional regulator with XRE-family HTH domain
MDIQEVLTAIEQYNATPQQIISANMRSITKKYQAADIADKVGVAIQTVYGWTKQKWGNKPSFEIALKLCAALDIDIAELIKYIEIPEIEDNRPKCKTEGCNRKGTAAFGLCWKCYQE